MKIGILIDSSTGFIEDITNEPLIRVIPLHLIINEKDDFLDDPKIVKENDLYSVLEKTINTSTSQASPGELIIKYDDMLKDFEHIVHMTIPQNLSGMHQTAVMISKEENYLGKVTIIENCITANCAKELALKFAQMIREGVDDPKKFQEESNLWTAKTWTTIIPGDLGKMARGGRARSLLLKMLKMIKAKVAIQWLEKPKKLGIARTYNSLLDKIIISLKATIKKDFHLKFVSLPCVNKIYYEQIKKYLNRAQIDFVEEQIPNVYPWHAGTNTMGLIAIEKSIMAKNKENNA